MTMLRPGHSSVLPGKVEMRKKGSGRGRRARRRQSAVGRCCGIIRCGNFRLTAAADRCETDAFRTVRSQPSGADRAEEIIGSVDLFRRPTVVGKGSRPSVSGKLDPERTFVGTTAGAVDERVQDETADEQQDQKRRAPFFRQQRHDRTLLKKLSDFIVI